MSVHLNRITHFYNSNLVFQELSCTLEQGSITLLTGENGSGKSTLLRLIAGILPPTSGAITWHEQQAPAPGSVAMLGHQHFLYPELTALENLLFWAQWHGKRPRNKAIEDAINAVQLGPYAEEKVGTFSQGMRQRLGLARVMLQQPQLLLLDEPASGLDTSSVNLLVNAIANFRQQGVTILWITHFVAQDALHAEYIWHLQNKRLAYTGAAKSFSLETAETLSLSVPLTPPSQEQCV